MLLRTLRLLRLARLLRVLERMKKGNLIRLLKLIFFIMLVVHWLTCLWFFLYRLLRDTVNLPWTFDLQLGDHPATFTYFLQGCATAMGVVGDERDRDRGWIPGWEGRVVKEDYRGWGAAAAQGHAQQCFPAQIHVRR